MRKNIQKEPAFCKSKYSVQSWALRKDLAKKGNFFKIEDKWVSFSMFRDGFFFYKLCFFSFYGLILCFFSWPGFAEKTGEASFRIRGGLSQLQSESPSLFLTQGQFHLKGKFYPSNNWKAQIHLLASNNYHSDFSIKESFAVYPFVNWLISESLELRLGRNIYENQFSEIVSINDYEPFLYTFDGVFLEYSTQTLSVDFWGAYLPKRWVGLEQVQEFKIGLGFFLDIKSISGYIDHFNAHVTYFSDSFFENSSQKMSRYGFGLKGLASPLNLTYTLVAVGHGDSLEFELKEHMYHFQLGYSQLNFFNSQFFVGYHKDSPGYEPWLYDRHENAGLLDIFLWGNLTYYFLGFRSSIAFLDLDLLFFDFRLTEPNKIPVSLGYFGSLMRDSGKNLFSTNSGKLGRELDIQLSTQVRESVELKLLAGLFMPDSESQKPLSEADFYNNIQLTGLYRF